MEDNIILQAMAATTFVKVAIDLLKLGYQPPQWLPPLLAVLLGIACIILLQVAARRVLDQAAIASAILSGVMAAGAAVGVTELQKRTLPSKLPE